MTKKNTNIFLIVSAVVIAAIVGVSFAFRNFYNNLNFDFKPTGNLGNLLSSLISAQQPNNQNQRGAGIYLDIPAKTIIDNANKIGINIKDLFASIKYNNEVVLRTKSDSAVLEDLTIPANTQNLEIIDTIEILINPSSVKLITELIAKNKPEVEITVRGRSLGLPVKKTFKHALEY